MVSKTDLKDVKKIEAIISAIILIEAIIIFIMTAGWGLGFFGFISYFAVFGSLSLFVYFLIFDFGDKKEKILLLILIILSTYVLLVANDISGISTIYTAVALILSFSLIPYVSFKNEGVIGEEQTKSLKYLNIIALIPLLIFGILSLLLELTTYLGLFILAIGIISTFLIVQNIKKI